MSTKLTPGQIYTRAELDKVLATGAGAKTLLTAYIKESLEFWKGQGDSTPPFGPMLPDGQPWGGYLPPTFSPNTKTLLTMPADEVAAYILRAYEAWGVNAQAAAPKLEAPEEAKAVKARAPKAAAEAPAQTGADPALLTRLDAILHRLDGVDAGQARLADIGRENLEATYATMSFITDSDTMDSVRESLRASLQEMAEGDPT